MHLEVYEPKVHEPALRHWAEDEGFQFNPDVLSDEGVVAVDDRGPVCACFMYKDPSASVVFVDNLTAATDRDAFTKLAAIRLGLHEIARRCATVSAIAIVTTSPFVAAVVSRMGIPTEKAYRTTVHFMAPKGD